MAPESFPDPELEIPRNYVRACILVLLTEEAGYGYELSDHLPDLGAAGSSAHRSGTYRLLHQMEREGLVLSHWDYSDVGPPRHVYTITSQGLEWLHLAAPSVEAMRRGLTRFLRRYRSLTMDA